MQRQLTTRMMCDINLFFAFCFDFQNEQKTCCMFVGDDDNCKQLNVYTSHSYAFLVYSRFIATFVEIRN